MGIRESNNDQINSIWLKCYLVTEVTANSGYNILPTCCVNWICWKCHLILYMIKSVLWLGSPCWDNCIQNVINCCTGKVLVVKLQIHLHLFQIITFCVIHFNHVQMNCKWLHDCIAYHLKLFYTYSSHVVRGMGSCYSNPCSMSRSNGQHLQHEGNERS